MTNQEAPPLPFSDFGFRISFGFRHSSFGFPNHVPQFHPLAAAIMARFVARAGAGGLRSDGVPASAGQSIQAN
jgi:hypothetical protein